MTNGFGGDYCKVSGSVGDRSREVDTLQASQEDVLRASYCMALLILINTANFAASYYVSTTGSDGDSGTSISLPWRHINYAAGKVTAGDTVFVKAGDYDSENVTMTANGTSARPIVVEGYRTAIRDNPQLDYTPGDDLDSAVMPLLDGGNRAAGVGITLNSRRYVIVRNMQVRNYSTAVYAYGARNVTVDNIIVANLGDVNADYDGKGICFGSSAFSNMIRNCIVFNACAEGISVTGDSNAVVSCRVFSNDNSTLVKSAMDYYIVIAGSCNTVDGCYTERIGNLGHVGHGIGMKGACEYNRILNCASKNFSGGLYVRHRGSRNNLFDGCTAYDCSIGLLIRDGACYNTYQNCRVVSGGDAIVFFDTDEDGGAQNAGNNNLITNCVVENPAGSAIRFSLYSLESTAYDNTISNCVFYGSPYLFNCERTNVNNKIVNSIITNVRNFAKGSFALNAVFAYCDFWNNGFSAPAGTGIISVDPLYADSANRDFHLKSQFGRWNPAAQSWVLDAVTSPAIDAGDPVSPFGNEPPGNGGRINLGNDGDTPYASRSSPQTRSADKGVSTNVRGSSRVCPIMVYRSSIVIDASVSAVRHYGRATVEIFSVAGTLMAEIPAVYDSSRPTIVSHDQELPSGNYSVRLRLSGNTIYDAGIVVVR